MTEQLDLLNVIGVNKGKTEEDQAIEKADKHREETPCKYNACNGSGMIREKEKFDTVTFCKCHEDKVMAQKLKNAHISLDFLEKDFSFDDGNTKAFLFKPKMVVEPFKAKKKNQTELDEPAQDFVNRHFVVKEESRIPGEIFQSFSEKNLALLQEKKKPANLLFFGDPGNGKTSISCLIGSYFLKHNKKVYFTTTEDFLNAIYDKSIDPIKIAKEYDLLILDELFAEYHTDSQWAKKKIKDILKIRDELKLMTICTSNGNPKEFQLLYGDSIMSLLKGNFFFFYFERESDGRLQNIHNMYDEFGF